MSDIPSTSPQVIDTDERAAAVAARVRQIRDEAALAFADGRMTREELLSRTRTSQADAERWWLTQQRQIPAKVRRVVLADGCAYCGDDATHVDHVTPVSRGGTNDRANLAASCKRCNEEKLDFTPAEWRAWREERGMGWPLVPLCVERMERLAELAAGIDEETAVAALRTMTANLRAEA